MSLDPIEQALWAHNMGNTNVLIALLTIMVDRGQLSAEELTLFSEAFAKPFLLPNARENELGRHIQEIWDTQMAQLQSDVRKRSGS